MEKHDTNIWFDTDIEHELLEVLNGHNAAHKVSFGNGTHTFSAVRDEADYKSMVQFQTTNLHMHNSNLLTKAIAYYITGFVAGHSKGTVFGYKSAFIVPAQPIKAG